MTGTEHTTTDEDYELVSLSKKGDTDAFEILVRKHQKRMFNIAYRMVGTYEDACEIVQAPLKETLPILSEETDRITAPPPLSEQPELFKVQKTPTPFGRQVGEMSSAADYGVGQEIREKTLSSAPIARALSLKKEEGIRLTVNVKDFEADSREIEKAVIQAGGKIIKTESLKNKDIIFAELSSERFKELLERLKLIGEVKEKDVLYALKGDMRIRIEILKDSIKEK